MLLKELLARQQNNAKTAVICGDDRVTYAELYRRAARNAEIIRARGCEYNNVSVFASNSIQYVCAFFTIQFLDKVVCPISVKSKQTELESVLEYCESGLVITDSRNKEYLMECMKDFDYSVDIYDIDSQDFTKAGTGKKAFKVEPGPVSPGEHDTALLLHTSGTTSRPKRVMLTHRNLVSNIEAVISSLGLSEKDITLISMPVMLASANTSQFLTHMYLGAAIVLLDGIFMPVVFFRAIQKERVTNATCSPAMLISILGYENKYNFDISSLRFVTFGGSPTPSDKLRLVIASFPTVAFIHLFGLTETAPRISHLHGEDSLRKIGSIGKPIPGVEVKVVDETGRETGVDEVGEMIVKSEGVMKGYYKRDYDTARVLKDGWLYTGDYARKDSEGYIYIVGRKKNVIISDGINIYPEEIEETLMCHPFVKEALVVAEKDENYGEVPVANVLLNDCGNVDGIENIEDIENVLINFCFNRLSGYKVPKRIYIKDSIAKTSTGKTVRPEKI